MHPLYNTEKFEILQNKMYLSIFWGDKKNKPFSTPYLNNHQPGFTSAVKSTVLDPVEFQWHPGATPAPPDVRHWNSGVTRTLSRCFPFVLL